MPYIPPDTLAKIKQIDLYTYLKTYVPSELVCISGSVYCTRTHDSLKISNGKWMWWSRGIGGRSALDYLIKLEGYSFLEAAELIMSQASLQPRLRFYQPKRQKRKSCSCRSRTAIAIMSSPI